MHKSAQTDITGPIKSAVEMFDKDPRDHLNSGTVQFSYGKAQGYNPNSKGSYLAA